MKKKWKKITIISNIAIIVVIPVLVLAVTVAVVVT